MSKQAILRNHHQHVLYSEKQWDLFHSKRKIACRLMRMFAKEGLQPLAYGSIARGDVHASSDIDITFLNPVPTFRIELILQNNGHEHYFKEIMMATPADSIKLYIHLSELESITVPITKLNKTSQEFYAFGGKVDFEEMTEEKRVAGIDKRLVLINPTKKGHEERSIFNNEAEIAKKIGISIETLNEREKVLLRREKHGRTGVFLKREIGMEESVEGVLKKLSTKKSIIRRKLFQR